MTSSSRMIFMGYTRRPRAFRRAAWGSRVYGQGDGFRCLRRAASKQTPTLALGGGKAQKTSRTFGVPRGAAVAACRDDQAFTPPGPPHWCRGWYLPNGMLVNFNAQQASTSPVRSFY